MESSSLLRSIHGPLRSSPHADFLLEKPALIPVSRVTSKHPSFSRILVENRRLFSSNVNRKLSCAKALEAISALTSDGAADTSDRTSEEPLQKKSAQCTTFPKGVEALLLEVCDETDVAELKLKVGSFELHLKRDITKAPVSTGPSIVSPTTAPPIPGEPMVESVPASQEAEPQKPPPAAPSPFTHVSSAKASKLEALEARGTTSYVLVSSPTVGSFRRGRTLKGKRQPPSCKEGDIIKEGQIIGFVDQFGSELPIRSDAAGEVLKVLFQDGEPVGYGDPLVAVLPAFHGIKSAVYSPSYKLFDGTSRPGCLLGPDLSDLNFPSILAN